MSIFHSLYENNFAAVRACPGIGAAIAQHHVVVSHSFFAALSKDSMQVCHYLVKVNLDENWRPRMRDENSISKLAD